MANLYRPSAHLYDLDPRAITRDDVGFYLAKAKALDGPVLELGCGTGRVSIPLADNGSEVWALDLSNEMLAQLRGKLKQLSASTNQRVHVVHGNMAGFDLGRELDLIIVPYRAFQALAERAEQESCLQCIMKHLSERGQFIMHVFKPRAVLDESWVQPETFDWEVTDPRTGKTVSRYERRRQIDVERQLLYVDLIYRIEDATRDIVEPLAISYFYEEQMLSMLQRHGFEIIDKFGYFDGRPMAAGPELIFICRRAKR
ncbi:MAG: class I SAM-dependent methyltransferase [Betaproteobacteria bacterium]|nr:class I SAM-dependent methyltransferase [Betaproteobacteria bacterium]